MKPCLLAAFLSLPALAAAAPPPVTPDNPQPLEGDFSLPMPGGREMVFRPVFLEVGDSLSAERKFKLGDRSGQYPREQLRDVVLTGAFIAPSQPPRPRDALYFMGKYEVTGGQFAAMVPPGEKPADPQLPQVLLTKNEIESFIEKYNSWLSAQPGDRLPKADGVPGFLRLPTDEEWEFAARGGRAVPAENFEATTPYSGPVGGYEWFAGPASSQGKLRKVGLLRPGPLGICDLLGNASEMTLLPFTLAEAGAKMGGHTVRGGSVQSELGEVRASLRFELPPYDAKGQPSRGDAIGFRLVVSSKQIITSENAGTFKGRHQPPLPKPPETPGPRQQNSITNTIGMTFVPVPVTDVDRDGKPVSGRTIWISIYETREQDFAAWQKQSAKDAKYPVTAASFKDAETFVKAANDFCDWLGGQEKKKYRLPTDHEWSCAVGLSECSTEPYLEKKSKNPGVFPWGEGRDPRDRGNYSSLNYALLNASPNATDNVGKLKPVGSYKPNRLGIYDLGGNVQEMCVVTLDSPKNIVCRGGSFKTINLADAPYPHTRETSLKLFQSSWRVDFDPQSTGNLCADVGFRIVLEN